MRKKHHQEPSREAAQEERSQAKPRGAWRLTPEAPEATNKEKETQRSPQVTRNLNKKRKTNGKARKIKRHRQTQKQESRIHGITERSMNGSVSFTRETSTETTVHCDDHYLLKYFFLRAFPQTKNKIPWGIRRSPSRQRAQNESLRRLKVLGWQAPHAIFVSNPLTTSNCVFQISAPMIAMFYTTRN